MWKCANCGKENQDNRNLCWNCSTVKGESFPEEKTPIEKPLVNQSVPESSVIASEISQPPQTLLRGLSVMFLIFAGLFTLARLWEMFVYNSDRDSSKIVGGDAYNYIIIAARGTGLICCGIVSALTSVVFSIWDLIDRQR